MVIKSFKIRFVGLYDTVSSYGLNFNDDTKDADDIKEINLESISLASEVDNNLRVVKNVVQLAAGHEWRKNFNLTNINSAGENGYEFILPGVHSDIGGGYESLNNEQTHLEKINEAERMIAIRHGSMSKEFLPITEKHKKGLVESGWYKPEQLKYKSVIRDYSIMYKGTRFIDKRYSYIPLNFMCQLATEKGAKFDLNKLNDPKKFRIPEKAGDKEHILNYVKSKLDQYINAVKENDLEARRKISYKSFLDFTNEKILINGFAHWSATGKPGSGPNKNNKRTIIDG